MKILIGTPVHQVKDYAMERWFKNVSELAYPADLFMVDNSPGTEYMAKIREYCAKYGLTNYKIEHLELPPIKEEDDVDDKIHERVARCREVIRHKVISDNYDAWFSWECDQIVPANTLDELIRIMKIEDFMMINHNNWTRETPPQPNADLGVSLISRECLEKHGFILTFGTDPDMPDDWISGDPWFKRQVVRDGGSYIEVFGIINPIYHI